METLGVVAIRRAGLDAMSCVRALYEVATFPV